MITLAALEEITDASGIAPRIEAVLPMGVRSRQLREREEITSDRYGVSSGRIV